MGRAVVALALTLLLAVPALAQASFTLSASVSGSDVTLRWEYPQPDPYAFLCHYQINGGPALTCGVLNGDSRENTEYQPNASYVFWLEAQADDGTTLAVSNLVSVTVSEPTATPDPTVTPTTALPTAPALTPIPTVVLQLPAIISTTAEIAAAQRDAWSPGSATGPLLLGLASVVVVMALLLVLVQWVRA